MNIDRVHWFIISKYLHFADHAKALEKPSHDRCVFVRLVLLSVVTARCVRVHFRLRCRSCVGRFTRPSLCLVLTWQSSMAWNMLHGWSRTKHLYLRIYISVTLFQTFPIFFFLRLLCASSIKDDTHATCWATSLNECSAWLFVWPRALVYQFGTHLKCFCSFKTSMLVSLPAAVVKSNVFNDKIVAVN